MITRSVLQTGNKFLAFFEKQAFVAKAIVGSMVVEYFRLKSFFRSLVQEMIEAFIIDGLFTAFARLVQKIFWIRVGVSIYVAILIKIQPDGYERVTDVFKHPFFWIW